MQPTNLMSFKLGELVDIGLRSGVTPDHSMRIAGTIVELADRGALDDPKTKNYGRTSFEVRPARVARPPVTLGPSMVEDIKCEMAKIVLAVPARVVPKYRLNLFRRGPGSFVIPRDDLDELQEDKLSLFLWRTIRGQHMLTTLGYHNRSSLLNSESIACHVGSSESDSESLCDDSFSDESEDGDSSN